ncbi:hypothetical protein [Burkholderia gladioli]|uniref:hypothetical protein n=1 Tax=Burkholderia gladioli TaxID=28095 RepID=UPI0034DB44F2
MSLILRAGLTALFAMAVSQVGAQNCPLAAQSKEVISVAAYSRSFMLGDSPPVVAYRSGVQLDDDGAPNAYHVGKPDGTHDDGLDSICVAGDVLEYQSGVLQNKYAEGGSIGKLGGKVPGSMLSATQSCKLDYLAIKKAGFPPCGEGHLCMRWYGVEHTKRSCGFNKVDDDGCGEPIRQSDASGKEAQFYLSTNILRRPHSPSDTRVQSDYANAAKVPYVVIPGKTHLPISTQWAAGDLAVVLWHRRIGFAVVGDVGGAGKLGEASRALLKNIGSSGAIDEKDPATTLIFPGTAKRWTGGWPYTKTSIDTHLKALLAEHDLGKSLSACEGMQALGQ